MELQQTLLWERLSELTAGGTDQRELAVIAERMFQDAVALSKTVLTVLPQYTLHDDVHLVRVVEHMGRLLPTDVLQTLGPMEIAALILAAAMHDLGMAPASAEVAEWIEAPTAKLRTVGQTEFLQFRSNFPDVVSRANVLRRLGRESEAREAETFIIAEYIRRHHGERVYRVITDDFLDRAVYGKYRFGEMLARVCRSHTEDPETLDALPADTIVGEEERCNWRFVAVVLRLADLLDFDAKRTPEILFSQLGVRDPVSVTEWRKHRSIAGWVIKPLSIAFAAQCEDIVVENVIRTFIRTIDAELQAARDVIARMHSPHMTNPSLTERYDLKLPPRVATDQVGPIVDAAGPRYHYLDIRFELERDQVTQILMGMSLYGERFLFLRELLQNATDTCRHRASLEKGVYSPKITVELSHEDDGWYVSVEDNGMGMNRSIIRNYFARIGRSYYRSLEFAQEGTAFRPISQFGIGVLSAFMAGDRLVVNTQSIRDDEPAWEVEIAGQGALFWMRQLPKRTAGTRVSVRLTSSVEELFPFLAVTPVLTAQRGTIDGPQFVRPPMPIERLAGTLENLAPHLNIGMTCKAEACAASLPAPGEAQLANTYVVDTYAVHVETRRLESFDIDLTRNGALGIEGRLRVFILTDAQGKLTMQLPMRNVVAMPPADSYMLAPGSDFGEIFQAEFGSISKTEWIRGQNGNVSGRTMPVFHGGGRLSQQGFVVPANIVTSTIAAGWPAVRLPLPTAYDLNLSGPFCLPLTADRKGIIRSSEAIAVCDAIADFLTTTILAALRNLVIANTDYFRSLKSHDARSAKYHIQLERLLAGPP